MATKVYTTEEVELQDGTVVQLRPAVIKTLRVFMKYIDEFGNSQTEEEALDILMDAAALCLRKQKPEYFDPHKERTATRNSDDGEKNVVNLTKGGATEEFEDVADMPTVYKILDVCGGVKLNDPNLLAAAAAAVGEN